MADITTNNVAAASGFSFFNMLNNAFDSLVRISESTPKAKAINALSAKTDAELAAAGTTRRDEVIRILGSTAYI